MPTLPVEQMDDAAHGSVGGYSPVDIKSVHVDPALPRNERIMEFIRQIKDPYCYKCGAFTVRVKYAENGISLEDCLRRILG